MKQYARLVLARPTLASVRHASLWTFPNARAGFLPTNELFSGRPDLNAGLLLKDRQLESRSPMLQHLWRQPHLQERKEKESYALLQKGWLVPSSSVSSSSFSAVCRAIQGRRGRGGVIHRNKYVYVSSRLNLFFNGSDTNVYETSLK